MPGTRRGQSFSDGLVAGQLTGDLAASDFQVSFGRLGTGDALPHDHCVHHALSARL
jgi:hypothetical protein